MLRTPSDFAALSAAPGVTTPLLGVRHRTVAATDSTPSLRLGIATSRKVGNAVVRNRIRRQLKSIARELAPQVRPGAEILIGVRTAASTAQSCAPRSPTACVAPDSLRSQHERAAPHRWSSSVRRNASD
jgi:ribonuclease P protein component